MTVRLSYVLTPSESRSLTQQTYNIDIEGDEYDVPPLPKLPFTTTTTSTSPTSPHPPSHPHPQVRPQVHSPFPPQPPLDILPMSPVLQMHLKSLHPHPRAGIIQLPRTVQTSDAGEIFETDGFPRKDGAGWVGGIGEGVDAGAAHGAFEAGMRVGAVERGEGVEEPGRWRGLDRSRLIWVRILAGGLSGWDEPTCDEGWRRGGRATYSWMCITGRIRSFDHTVLLLGRSVTSNWLVARDL